MTLHPCVFINLDMKTNKYIYAYTPELMPHEFAVDGSDPARNSLEHRKQLVQPGISKE